jgi:lysine-specific demethylase 3
MDMADAVNIMLYAVDEHGQEGVAAWDIFRSQDSSAIRDFLRKEYPPERYQYTDPIHSQHFFLTATLRKKLWDEYRVKSWRIYQRPGEAVFIPAGCAHQVRMDVRIAIIFLNVKIGL